MIDRTLFNVLLFLNLDTVKEYHSSGISAYNSGSNVPYANRALIEKVPTHTELQELAAFMGSTPYTVWALPNSDIEDCVNNNGFARAQSFPIMTVDLSMIKSCIIDKNIHSKKVENKSDLEIWIAVCAQAYGLDVHEFRKYIMYLQSTKNSAQLLYYIGYWHDQPAATSMFVIGNNVVGIHWIATVSNFRNRGLGTAVTCLPYMKSKQWE